MPLDTIDSGFTPATVQVGTISIFISGHIPNGWFVTNGQAIDRSTNSTLFSITGTTFGAGNGSTTFNVPTISAPGANLVYAIKSESYTPANAVLIDG
jgi:microcystin-dependent protein